MLLKLSQYSWKIQKTSDYWKNLRLLGFEVEIKKNSTRFKDLSLKSIGNIKKTPDALGNNIFFILVLRNELGGNKFEIQIRNLIWDIQGNFFE